MMRLRDWLPQSGGTEKSKISKISRISVSKYENSQNSQISLKQKLINFSNISNFSSPLDDKKETVKVFSPEVANAKAANFANDQRASDQSPNSLVAGCESVSAPPPAAVVTLPRWCRADCPTLEQIDLPNEGVVAGCVPPLSGTWRRLDQLTGCPVAQKRTIRPALPGWCTPSCGNFHVSECVACCCQENDERHWQRDRIDLMTACPKTRARAPEPESRTRGTIQPVGDPVTGLPCGGCGLTQYRRVLGGFVYPDGGRVDGWHCGGSTCGIKLLTGNKEVDQKL